MTNGYSAFNKELSPEAPEWFDDAVCRDGNGTLNPIFYSADEIDIDRAKSICSGCSVAAACLEFALENREKHGVWGGASEKDRRRIIRQRQRAKRRLRAES